ncbi:MAG: oxalate/formate MFS antiporter [Acetobacteraceae bacterium]|nr:oxalate/formate MFS antiporter [Acetobacteraceae bacterium]
MSASTSPVRATRWSQLWLGVVCMILIANLQYAWTLFVNPIHQARGWSLAEIQVAFSIFVATETWLTPLEGWIVDTLGPRRGPPLMIGGGGVLVAVAWVLNAYASSLAVLYVCAAISGTGAGAVYATCVGNAVKWFADRRGLAVGITAAGFGAGAALTVVPIQLMIQQAGYQSTFFWFGLGQGAILLLIAPIMRGPFAGELQEPTTPWLAQSTVSATPAEVLRAPVFWLLYAMFVAVSASGLMATAQLAPIARDFGIANQLILWGVSALSVAVVVDSVMNGLARPFFGWVSDRIGREPTMAVAFTLGALSYALLGLFGHNPWGFVICAGLIFFTWGEIFSLFPSTCTDLFGTRYATANASLLYTAKGASAWLVPLANLLQAGWGGWRTVFLVAAAANMAVVLAALFILRPARARRHAAEVVTLRTAS